jgi:diguanylate cyclase (GGDEF)-like protein
MVLAAVGAALREGVRGFEAVGRFGGDEFLVILPEADHDDAVTAAERLRTRVAGAVAAAMGRPIGASAGIAVWRPGLSADRLIADADRALSANKARTRVNRPALADETWDHIGRQLS